MHSLKKRIQKVGPTKPTQAADRPQESEESATEATRTRFANMFFRGDKNERRRHLQKHSASEFDIRAGIPESENDTDSVRSFTTDLFSRGRRLDKRSTSLARFKQKALGKPRSSDESNTSGSQSVAPSISTLASAALKPFPLIRSQSSISGGSPVRGTHSEESRPRRKTDGEAGTPPAVESERRSTNASSDGAGKRNKSLSMSRTGSISLEAPDEELSLPLHGQETESQYIDILQEQGFGPAICACLSHETDEFYKSCLLEYVRKFSFANEPIDMSLRKLLMFQRLPMEAQQIERVLQAFSQVYHETNDQLFESSDQVYFVVFSMVILHTDTFNKNVKHKMTKNDYIRSSYCEGVPLEVFEYLYDNVTYTQFIHTEDEALLLAAAESPAVTSELTSLASSTTSIAPLAQGSIRRTSFGITKDLSDPYILILEGRLHTLRPSLGKVLGAEDPFKPYFFTAPGEIVSLRNRVINGPTIQLISQLSRPDAYTRMPSDVSNLKNEELMMVTTPGVVNIKVMKMGILQRRESAKKMLYSTRCVWREWGAILTESQLYLFKNVAWVRSLLAESSTNAEPTGAVTRTALEEFNASLVLSTKDMAALQQTGNGTTAEDEKFSFILTMNANTHSYLSAADEDERVDWMKCINFAATYSTQPVPLIPQTPHMNSETLQRAQAGIASSPNLGTFYRSASDTSLTSISAVLAQRLRGGVLKHQIQDLDHKLESLQQQIESQERDCRHLKILAPIQQKTRENLVFVAGQYASKSEWYWLDRARYKCYRNILEMDLRLTEARWNQQQAAISRASDLKDSTSLSTSDINDSCLKEDPAETASSDNEDGEREQTASHCRNGDSFDVRGHRFSLVDFGPKVLEQTRTTQLEPNA